MKLWLKLKVFFNLAYQCNQPGLINSDKSLVNQKFYLLFDSMVKKEKEEPSVPTFHPSGWDKMAKL